MRFFLLPISARRTLIYCDKHLSRKLPKPLPAPPSSKATNGPITAAATQAADDASSIPPSASPGAAPVADAAAGSPYSIQNLQDKFTTKAADTWTNWEKAPSGWKKQVTVYGNKLLRRIPYEEWGLKSIPPFSDKKRSEALEKYKAKPVHVLFPPSFLKEGEVMGTLRSLATERQDLHKRRMWTCLIGAPLTLPFALVPVVPNIPGFYLLFRAWSHYRALYGARHLEYLVQNDLVQPSPNEQLDQLYNENTSKTISVEAKGAVADAVKDTLKGADADVMLLNANSGDLISKSFGVSEMGVEIERAVEQVEQVLHGEPKPVEENKEKKAQ